MQLGRTLWVRESSSAVRLSHRSMVEMHRWNQWYPKQGVHNVIFVGPYIKGDSAWYVLTVRGSDPRDASCVDQVAGFPAESFTVGQSSNCWAPP